MRERRSSASILRRGGAGKFLEYSLKVRKIRIADGISRVRDRKGLITQQVLCLLDPDAIEIALIRQAGHFFKNAGKMIFGKSGNARHLIETDFRRKVVMDIF